MKQETASAHEHPSSMRQGMRSDTLGIRITPSGCEAWYQLQNHKGHSNVSMGKQMESYIGRSTQSMLISGKDSSLHYKG